MAEQGGSGDLRGDLKVFRDERGTLTLADLDSLPFAPARAYVLHSIPQGARRAGHAHRRQQRWLAVVCGTVQVTEDDGRGTRSFDLEEGSALHVPSGVWYELCAASEDVVILVLASGPHEPSDYVHERSAMPLALASTAEQTA